ncbi:MAG: universal stress protein [Polyangiaceae bacterium]|nr:universal stress protein [Polyangiaceae bacterium]
MMNWKTLLVPHDFSTAAERAHSLACDLAAMCGGRVVLLHVSPIPHGLDAGQKLVPDGSDSAVRIEDYLQTAAKRRLETAMEGRTATESVAAVVTTGDVADTILAQAVNQKADVIVMGTHGRSGVRRLLLGSVAERVLRRANVPVVVVRDPDPDGDKHLKEEDQVRAEEQG